MKLTEDSHAKIEAFYREISSDKEFRLPAIRFYAGNFSAILTRVLNVHGITVGNTIFLSPQVLIFQKDICTKINAELAAHEITHVLQYEREGLIRFFCKYLTSYTRNLRLEKRMNADARMRAYLEIPFEIEARARAAAYVDWNLNSAAKK